MPLAETPLSQKDLLENKIFIQHLIDENKALKKELQTLKKTAKYANQNHQNLLANIGHEIRTPLHAIVGLSNSLKDITNENDREENIAIIENSAFVLGAIISNILDTAKLDSRNVKLDIHPFDLKALIKNLQTTFIYRLKDKPVEFITEVDDNLPNLVRGDEQKLLHVLFNVLSNSEKFTDNGIIKLSVNILNSSHNTILTAFTIEDTGTGLNNNNPGLSYERFGDYIEKKKKLYKEGHALGLPVTNTLIKLLKGEVKISNNNEGDPMRGSAILESNANKGVKITIVLPFKQYFEKDSDTIIPTKDETLLSTLDILIAEDNNMNKKYFSILLNKWNINYTFVNNGNEALEKLSAHDFDLVLMDINMPELDGFETTEAIRKLSDPKKSSIPVIGVSAAVLNEYKIKGKKIGMNYFLSKPFKPEQLKDLLMQFAVKKQPHDVSLIDMNMLRDYFGNNYAAAAEVFRIFIDESIPEINGWEELLQNKGKRELGVRAHALKSAMEMLGLYSLSGKCFELENACASNEEKSLLEDKIKNTRSEVNNIEPHVIKQYQFINKMANKHD